MIEFKACKAGIPQPSPSGWVWEIKMSLALKERNNGLASDSPILKIDLIPPLQGLFVILPLTQAVGLG